MDFFSLCFDIDRSIPLQKRLVSTLDEVVDLRSEEDQLRLWASRKGLGVLRKTIETLRKRYQEPWLTFFGSGDFHHLTLLLLETLPKTVHPLTLVLIDNHPDWYQQWPQYHCGNWVSGAIRLPWIRSTIMIGQDSSDLSGWHSHGAPYQELFQGRIQLYPYERKRIRVPFRWPSLVLGAKSATKRFYGVDLHFDTVSELGAENLFSDLAKRLEGQNIYISIDKDCLERRVAITDWEQGKLSLSGLLDGIMKLRRSANVIGADVCGERAPYPLRGILKRIESGRFFSQFSAPIETDHINEQTNLSLFELFRAF